MRWILPLVAIVVACVPEPVARVVPKAAPPAPSPSPTPDPAPPFITLEQPDGSGWTVGLIEKRGLPKANAELIVTYTTAEGVAVESRPVNVIPTRFIGPPRLFDIDEDGSAELLFGVWRNLDHVLRFRDGRIEPYPMPKLHRLHRFEDIDGDGRRDPIYRFLHTIAMTCRGEAQPIIVEHAGRNLPGGELVMVDAVIRDRLRKSCAGTRRYGWIRAKDPLHHIQCARMNGVSSEVAVRRVLRECAPHRIAARTCTGPCQDLDVLLAFAQVEPPLRLVTP